MRDWEATRTEIEENPDVRGAGGVIHLTGVMSHAQESCAVLALAVEPDREHRMGFDLKLRDGADLPAERPGEGDDRVLLGSSLARALAARSGDVVTVLAMTTGGTLNAVDMKVSGIFTTGLQDLDARLVKMHIASAQRLIESERVSSLFSSPASANACPSRNSTEV